MVKKLKLLNKDGVEIEWFVVFKLPMLNDDQIDKPCHGIPRCTEIKHEGRANGLYYLYADSSAPELELQTDCITHSKNALNRLIDQRESADHYLYWNDEIIKGGKKSVNYDSAHSKGYIYRRGDRAIITHTSTPFYPDPDNPRLGCNIDDNVLNSQHIFAFVMDKPGIDKWIDKMKQVRINIWKQKGFHEFSDRDRKNQKKEESESDASIPLVKKSGISLITKIDNVIPWNHVANVVKTNLDIISWFTFPLGSGPFKKNDKTKCTGGDEKIKYKQGLIFQYKVLGFPAFCGLGGFQKYLGKKVINMHSSNHAKIGIGCRRHRFKKQCYVIFGSLNMQGDSTEKGCKSGQIGRNGEFYVIKSRELYRSFRKLFKKKYVSYDHEYWEKYLQSTDHVDKDNN